MDRYAGIKSTRRVAGRGHYAVAVPKQGQPNRVTVTADFLSLVDCIIFLASGADKASG